MKDALKVFFGSLGAIVLLLAVFSIFGLFGLGWERKAAPYREETRRQTYESSRAYQQGMAVDLDGLCRQWRVTTNEVEKAGLADTIRLRSARYNGELPANVERCLNEVR